MIRFVINLSLLYGSEVQEKLDNDVSGKHYYQMMAKQWKRKKSSLSIGQKEDNFIKFSICDEKEKIL